MKNHNFLERTFRIGALLFLTVGIFNANAVTISNTPLATQISAKPMIMLVASKDHKLFFEAYNDASDLDGDGVLEVNFKPTITYYGIFDSKICYEHNGSATNSGLFTPKSITSDGKCSNRWSGNWLNYMTTSRIDALRKVLYGGYRELDTSTSTILRRAYIPQDGHSWAKEYASETENGYKLSDYTPLSSPSAGRRHFFGNVTLNASTNCLTLDTCSNLPPSLSVVINSTKRVWDWASKEKPVLDSSHGGTRTDYTVRVEVCKDTFIDGCRKYGTTTHKPIGLLHDYGENESMLFGLLTGSYDQNMSGGVLRKVISSFKPEVDSATGIFTSNATIVRNFNNLRIRDFNNGNASAIYRNGSFRTGPMVQGAYPDWGNPVGEMMYEALRYFGGKKAPTPSFSTSSAVDTQVGLTKVSKWDNPFDLTDSAAKAPRCARSSMLVMSDVYTSYDADQMPGSPYSSLATDIAGFDSATLLRTIGSNENIHNTNRYIGQSTSTNFDYAPTSKSVTDLSLVRGLAPEETTKQGSYSAAAVAYFAKLKGANPGADDIHSVDSYFLALSSTLPKIEIPIPGKKTIQIIPFAKTINGSATVRTKGSYQPTDQIVDLYITKSDLNGASKEMKFRINFEADEQGNDFDTDVLVEYTVKINTDSTVTVKVEVIAESTGSNQNLGYVISGTQGSDGIHLVVQDKTTSLGYFLNTPSGRNPGYCDSITNIALTECRQLPTIGSHSSKTFTAATSSVTSTTDAKSLENPLWYAAKWGGFNDRNSNQKPDLANEWDLNGDGIPDNYFLVQNPLKIRETLKKAFDEIFKANSSASNVIANSSSISTNSRVFQARFDASYWSGDLVAYPVTSSGVSNSTEWAASEHIPPHGSRKLFVSTSTGLTKNFLWSQLPAAEQTALENSDILDYLRGERSKELQNAGTLRDRGSSVLGDIVHSSPFYVKDTDTIYVGANDGMLHAFNAASGAEIFGFIPAAVVPKLKTLSSTGYTHDYFVDGDVTVSARTTETGNKNLLFSALGRGGKGLFALDVTNPTTFGTGNFLWEYTPQADSTAAADPDLGLIMGRPIYTKVNQNYDKGDGKGVKNYGAGALIFSNGYNSNSGKAVLYIFILNSSGQISKIKKIDTLAGSDNGMATPGVFDSNGDGAVDYVYGGDLKGNVWKFDLTSGDPDEWVVALSGSPIFVAKDSSNKPQPITSQVTAAVNTLSSDTNFGKQYLFFGSGSYFKTGDPSDSSVQSWYGLIDEGSVINSREDLRSRSISATATQSGKLVRTFSVAVANDMVNKKGWYLDLTISSGERMVTESILYKLALPVLISSSIIPTASDPCVPGGTGFINAINPFNGAALTIGILDINNNGKYSDDKIGTVFVGSVDLGIGLPSRSTLIGNRLAAGGTSSEVGKRVKDVTVNVGITPIKGRVSWREIIKD